MFTWKWKLSEIKQDKPVTVFSTFSCGGGSSMGYKRAGFKMLGNVELDPRVNALYVENLHPVHNFNMDLREFNNLPNDQLPPELFNLDILDGSPPCSSFSTAGARERLWGVEKKFREGQKEQTLDDLFFIYLDTVAKLRPRIFVAENVTGLLKGNARGYVNEIIKKARSLGYRVQLFNLNSAKMNVPQKRERVFFIGTREDLPPLRLDFSEPVITFGAVRSKKGGKVVRGKMGDLVRHRIPGDKDLGDINERLYGKTTLFGNKIIADGDVCNTITSAGTFFRNCDGMTLSDADLVSCQTFPQDYNFLDQSPQYVCGMSVPPNMMAHIASQIWLQWLKK